MPSSPNIWDAELISPTPGSAIAPITPPADNTSDVMISNQPSSTGTLLAGYGTVGNPLNPLFSINLEPGQSISLPVGVLSVRVQGAPQWVYDAVGGAVTAQLVNVNFWRASGPE